jgi:hypothetical protein
MPMTNKQFPRLVIGVVFSALALASCGGGGSSTAASLTKPQFIKKAEALCLKAEAERGKVIRAAAKNVPKNGKVSSAEQDAIVLAALPPYKDLPAEIEALGAPDGEQDKVEEIAAALEKSLERSETEPKSAVNDEAFVKFNELVIAYGLDSCRI